jgi:hypothetical protein
MSARLDTARARVGPLVLGIGMAMIAVAFVGYGADHQPEAASPPRPPSVTSSSPPPAAKHAKPAQRNRAASTNRGRGSDGGHVAAAGAPKTSTGGGSFPRQPSTIAPSGPTPSPPATSPPVTTSCDVGLSLLALNACLKLGGTP